MSQAVEVKERILGAIERLEFLQVSVNAHVEKAKDLTDAHDADLGAAGQQDRAVGGETERLRDELITFKQKIGQWRRAVKRERQQHTRQLEDIGGSISRLRDKYAALADQHVNLQQAMQQGLVDASLINHTMSAELEALRAERDVERQELLLVQRQLEALLNLDETLDEEIDKTDLS